ncbi:MAG TPA: M90 family metallopeptidase [Fontimonas sp.]
MQWPPPEAFVIAGVLLAFFVQWLRKPRRAKQRHAAPPAWREQVYALVPQTQYLTAAQRPRYEHCVEEFLQGKRFIGCGGLTVDDDMRIAVAGLAGLMLLRSHASVFPMLHSVLLYPDRFFVHSDEPDELGLVNDEPVEHLGESWQGDRVALSWADVQAALDGDEVNVVVHEFAHQLDDENPETEGAPAMRDYARWSEIMDREFRRLQRHRRPPVLDPYGAESPGEFFGVVSEAYFQRGFELRQHHAELYELLRDYYQLDTASHSPWAVRVVEPGGR